MSSDKQWVEVFPQITHKTDMAPTTAISHIWFPCNCYNETTRLPIVQKHITKCLPMACLHNQIPPSKQIFTLCPRICNCAHIHLMCTPPATAITIKCILPFTPNLSHNLTKLFPYTLEHLFLIQYIVYTPNIPWNFHSATLLQNTFLSSHICGDHMGGNLKNKWGILEDIQSSIWEVQGWTDTSPSIIITPQPLTSPTSTS